MTNQPNTLDLPLVGMDCPDCAIALERGVRRLPGVHSADVNFAAARMRVEYEPGAVDRELVVHQIESLGYGVGQESEAAVNEPQPFRFESLLPSLSSGFFLMQGCLIRGFTESSQGDFAANSLFAFGIACGGWSLGRSALQKLRALTLGPDLLMLLAAIGAAALGDWYEGSMVVFLYSLGIALESIAVEKTRASIRSLVNASPEKTLQIDPNGGDDREVVASSIRPGDRVRIPPGARVPVDGVVESGESSLVESSITGESLPAFKGPGDFAYAGTLNGGGSLIVRSTREYSETTISTIVHLVEDAQARKARTQRITERFGVVYTPVVLGIAIVTGLVWPLAFGLPLSVWLLRGLTFLVVACPCALVLSAPVAVAAAIGRAAGAGVLIKGGGILEALGTIRSIAFDKTGTLTFGRAEVVDVAAASGATPEEVLGLAAAVEIHSQHPLGRAIVQKARSQGVHFAPSETFNSTSGRGAEGKIAGACVRVGNEAFLVASGIAVDSLEAQSTAFAAAGSSLVVVARDEAAIGVIAIRDTIRETSIEAIRRLRARGIDPIVMLTGDVEASAAEVGRSLNLTDIRSGLHPDEKVAAIRELKKRHGGVAMVGDGVNDAPALAEATVGIAMGGGGTAAAIETADATLMGDDLTPLTFALDLSRQAVSIIHQNLAISGATVVALIGLILFNRIDLASGVLFHEGSALIVLLNGMRLIGKRERG